MLNQTNPIRVPAQAEHDRAQLTAYTQWLERHHERRFETYDDLWNWSVTDLDGFWGSLWAYFDIQAFRPPTAVLDRRELPLAQWFPGAELSYAAHVFAGRDDDAAAIVHAGELRELSETTWGELRSQTAAMAESFRELGIGKGDRVAACLPARPEAVIAFLACASIGAIWCPCPPDLAPGRRWSASPVSGQSSS